MSTNYKFFQHKDCEYFPCHKGIPEEDFNCLFCYCPLYFLGEDCGGGFSYTKKGVKNCMDCGRPHRRENYDEIIDILRKAMDLKAKDCPVASSGEKPQNGGLEGK